MTGEVDESFTIYIKSSDRKRNGRPTVFEYNSKVILRKLNKEKMKKLELLKNGILVSDQVGGHVLIFFNFILSL